jgi:hypothetical protein
LEVIHASNPPVSCSPFILLCPRLPLNNNIDMLYICIFYGLTFSISPFLPISSDVITLDSNYSEGWHVQQNVTPISNLSGNYQSMYICSVLLTWKGLHCYLGVNCVLTFRAHLKEQLSSTERSVLRIVVNVISVDDNVHYDTCAFIIDRVVVINSTDEVSST